MQKYPKGTLVEVVKHPSRADLIGERFVVGETRHGNLDRGDLLALHDVLIYMTPFPSIRPEYKGSMLGLTEDYLKPVQDEFPEDEGFEFDESKPVWTPIVVVEDGEALVV